MSPSKASREHHRERYRQWQQRRYPDATESERAAIHDAHKAAMAPWRERRERYQALPMEPLRIVLRTGAQVVHYDPPYLEGLLAWVVVMEETAGEGTAAPPRYTPLPLEAAGFYGSGGQLPLWRASVLAPVGVSVRDVVHVHKRSPDARHANYGNIKTGAGRYMDRRVPLPTLLAHEWDALCYGNGAEIERLLANLQFVGKRRSSGFGEVGVWSVEPWADGEPLVRDGVLAHAIPQEHNPWRIDEPPVLVGWTPPHWNTAFWSPGWPVGTPVANAVDWHVDAPA